MCVPGVHIRSNSESDCTAHSSVSNPGPTEKSKKAQSPLQGSASILRGRPIIGLPVPTPVQQEEVPCLLPPRFPGLPARPLTLGVGWARLTRACRSGVADTVASSRPCGSSCVTVVKKAGAGSAAEGKCAAAPFSSLCPRK